MRLLRLLPLLALPFLGACALERDYIEVRHPPPASVAPVPGAAQVSARVVTTDARDTNRDRVSVKKNGYGMEMAAIVATNDVVAEVGAAVSAVLTAQGFSTSGGPGEVRVDLLRFFNDFKSGFWTGTAEADVSINMRVIDPAGAILYARVICSRNQIRDRFGEWQQCQGRASGWACAPHGCRSGRRGVPPRTASPGTRFRTAEARPDDVIAQRLRAWRQPAAPGAEGANASRPEHFPSAVARPGA
jgi:uncharacterized lipoprotein YajG